MPLYGFHCTECGKDTELLISAGDTPTCPRCGSEKLDRLISRVAPPGKSRGIAKAARSRAAREGHLSQYKRSERRS
ncbi:FmdB family zinc ribbon protein [Bradyrhizobium sp.]|uniref:FmdB family zinc ribbon protein n=1 Tax=Bradyrhizobium sp. TaxID=376 RepID=UPI004037B869